MLGNRTGWIYPSVLIDLNTQVDFCSPDGAHPVANAPQLICALRRVVAWAKRNGAPLVSSIHSRRASEVADRGADRYCVDGTDGQRKMEFTLFPTRTGVQADNTLAVPLNLFATNQQVIFRQRGADLLGNPKADRFLTQMSAHEFILFGNVLEGAVKAVALALLARQRCVTVVRDACGFWDLPAAELTLRLFTAKGVHLISVDQLLERRLPGRRYFRLRLREASSEKNGNGHAGSTGQRNGIAKPAVNGRRRRTADHAEDATPKSLRSNGRARRVRGK